MANLAVNAVGVDVTTCYNYILDQNLGTDIGGAVYPIDNCPHLQTMVTEMDPNELINAEIFEGACQYREHDRDGTPPGKLKQEFDDDDKWQQGQQHLTCPKGENWWCLTCHGIFCSRYVNGHGLEHWKDTKNERRDDKQMETEASGIKAEQPPGHCIAVSLADLSVWCHECGAYLLHDQNILKPILVRLEECKFQEES